MGGTGTEIYTYPLEALPPYDASGDGGGENRAGESPSPCGSWTFCEGPRPPSVSSSAPAKPPVTGGYPPTLHDTGARSIGLTSSTPPAKAFSIASTAVGKASTSSPVDWVGQRRQADLPTFNTLQTLFWWSPEPLTTNEADTGEVGSPVVRLQSNRRVMSRSMSSRSPSQSIEHSYLFCPRDDPAEYHQGCWCKCSSCSG